MNFRLKQIGLSLCLVAALLVGSISACACSHHQETKKAEETSCHSNGHEKTEVVQVPSGTQVLDVDCECFVSQPSPVIVSKSETKKSKTGGDIAEVATEVSHVEFISVAVTPSFLPETSRQFSKTTILESLLPARAPPRL